MAISREALVTALDRLLDAGSFSDYCPNGLQVAGCRDISKVVSGVTACQDLVEEAVRLEAGALLVHHGYFWKGEDPCIVGIKQQRIKKLLDHGINLIAYHLPLDAHPTLGNNARLGDLLGFSEGEVLEDGLVNLAEVAGQTGVSLSGKISSVLGRTPLHIRADREIRRVGWCTGAAQGYLEKAIAAGADAFITGEVSEPTVHIAREYGVHFFAAGHHATERYGVQAVGEWIAESFGVQHQFVDIDNPV